MSLLQGHPSVRYATNLVISSPKTPHLTHKSFFSAWNSWTVLLQEVQQESVSIFFLQRLESPVPQYVISLLEPSVMSAARLSSHWFRKYSEITRESPGRVLRQVPQLQGPVDPPPKSDQGETWRQLHRSRARKAGVAHGDTVLMRLGAWQC